MQAKMKAKWLLIYVSVFALSFVVYSFSVTKSNFSGQFTASDVRSIKFGDDLEEVIRTLGHPFKVRSLKGIHDLSCPSPKDMFSLEVNTTTDIRSAVHNVFADTAYCCEGNKDDLTDKWCTLVYSKPVELSKYYPMLWVHLDSNFQVSQVFAKRYEGILGLDDPAIYSLDSQGVWENEIVFNDCFKK